MDINDTTQIELLAALLQQSNTVFNVKDLDGKYLYANNQTRSYFSDPNADYAGKTDFDFFPSEIAQGFRQADLQVINSREKLVVEEPVNTPNGIATYLSVKFPIISDDNTILATGMFSVDITQRKQREEKQLNALEKYQRLITALGEIAYEYQSSIGRFQWSGRYQEILGYDHSEMSVTKHDWFSRIHPDDIQHVRQEIKRAKRENLIFDAEYRYQCKNGNYLTFHDRCVMTVDPQGHTIDVIGVMRDISAQRKDLNQKEQLQRQIQQIQKMDALGQLTGGIAHDFNNILSSIRGYTELSMSQIGTPDASHPVEGYLNEVIVATDRAAQLVQQMLAFSRGKTGIPQLITPESGIHDAIRLLHAMIPSSVAIEFTLKHHNRYIKIDPINLQQVLINLIVNARDAIQSQSGKIKITLDYKAASNVTCASCHEPIRKKMISIAVQDTGEGIASTEILNRMFDPFFTTKADRKGSGMGLSVVHGIMHSCGGHILVDSIPGKGTCVELLFVESLESPEQLDSVPQEEPLKLRTSIRKNDNSYIMVVDDEFSITNYLSKLLHGSGFQVESFNSPLQALEAFKASPETCSLLITDQTMPELTGDKLARTFLEIRPDMPIIMCSGYSDLINAEKAKSLGISAYLDKPLSMDVLFKNIYQLLRDQSEISV